MSRRIAECGSKKRGREASLKKEAYISKMTALIVMTVERSD